MKSLLEEWVELGVPEEQLKEFENEYGDTLHSEMGRMPSGKFKAKQLAGFKNKKGETFFHIIAKKEFAGKFRRLILDRVASSRFLETLQDHRGRNPLNIFAKEAPISFESLVEGGQIDKKHLTRSVNRSNPDLSIEELRFACGEQKRNFWEVDENGDTPFHHVMRGEERDGALYHNELTGDGPQTKPEDLLIANHQAVTALDLACLHSKLSLVWSSVNGRFDENVFTEQRTGTITLDQDPRLKSFMGDASHVEITEWTDLNLVALNGNLWKLTGQGYCFSVEALKNATMKLNGEEFSVIETAFLVGDVEGLLSIVKRNDQGEIPLRELWKASSEVICSIPSGKARYTYLEKTLENMRRPFRSESFQQNLNFSDKNLNELG